MKFRKFVVLLLLPLLVGCFLSVTAYGQLVDTSLIKMQGNDWSIKVDSVLASSLDSRNSPYMTSKSATEKEIFLQLNTLEDCKSGVVQFKVDMQGLTAYKQLPLTEKEIAEGSFRPKNVENSFACFDSSGKKVLHIYASKIIDSKGVEVWLDQDLKDGLLTVYLPKPEVLETLSFPLLLDPTFGYTDVGGTVEATSGYVRLNNYTAAVDFTLDELWVYASGAEGTEVRVALYNSTFDLLEETSALVLGGSATWLHEHMSSTVYDSGVYWIATIFSEGVSIYYDDVAGNVFRYKSYAYGAFPASCSDSSVHGNPSKFSSYAVYTEFTATPTPTPYVSPTPFPEGAMDDTDWWLSILMVALVILNFVLIVVPFALVRFAFGAFSFMLSALALSYQIPLSPYMQLMSMVIAVLGMFLATRARE